MRHNREYYEQKSRELSDWMRQQAKEQMSAPASSESQANSLQPWTPTKEELEYVMANCSGCAVDMVLEEKARHPEVSLEELVQSAQLL